MSDESPLRTLPLPDRPNLRHLKDQAKDLLKSGSAASLADAQFKIARRYGFDSWPKLKVHVESLAHIEQLKRAVENHDVDAASALMARPGVRDTVERLHGASIWARLTERLRSLRPFVMLAPAITKLKAAIDASDLETVTSLMTAHPSLHAAPMGYGNSGPLTYLAECGVPSGTSGAARLAMADWMIVHGSNVHQGGDAPLMRAALSGERVPMMELLVSRGADVNAEWNGEFPIIFAACEAVDPVALKWLLDHGANPNCARTGRTYADSALDYVAGSYVRSPELAACIDLLLAAGGTTRYDIPSVLDLLRGRLNRLNAHLDADPNLVQRRFPGLDFGTTGGRMLTLKGATLLHVAAEYRSTDGLKLLLNRGADVNARASIDARGVGGQTAIFHAVTQFENAGIPAARLLVDRGADLSIRVKLPGHYERPEETVECTPLGYALKFEHETQRSDKTETINFLRERGAPS